MKSRYIGSDENEKALRFFQNERPKESVHQVFKATDNDAAGSGYCVLFQGNGRRVRHPLSNPDQFVSSRLRGTSPQAEYEVGL